MKKEKKKMIWIKILTILLLFLLVILYAIFIGTKGLNIKEYKIINQSLPTSYYGLKIVHFSDLHYGRTIKEKELINLINKINLTKPDVVVFTGDLVDKDCVLTEEIKSQLENNLKNIKSTYGNYYIKGNHDTYFNSYELIMNNSNFINLNNNYDIITNMNKDKIFIGGAFTYNDKEPEIDIVTDHLKDNEYDYKILIMHMPDSVSCLKNEYKVILELLVPPTKKDLKLTKDYDRYLRLERTIGALKEIQENIKVNIWKLEGFDEKEWKEINKITKSKIIFLGRGESKNKVIKWLLQAKKSKNIIGFAIGRTTFLEPITKYIEGSFSKEKASLKIANNFKYFIDLFDK